MKKILTFLYCCLLSSVLLNASENPMKLQVSVSIPPLHFFVHEIAKNRADISIIVPANKNAELYEPNFKDMQTISKTDIFIGVGIPFENIWLPKIIEANRQKNNIVLIKLHELLGLNEHLHIWFSIINAKKITTLLAQNFAKQDPKYADFYYANAKNLLQKLDVLNEKIHKQIEEMPKRDFIVYHPIFDIFDKEYGLIEHSLEQHGKTYGIKEILALSEFGKQSAIKRVFAEYENKDIKTLAHAMKARVVLINPLAQNYIENLEYIVSEIARSYED